MPTTRTVYFPSWEKADAGTTYHFWHDTVQSNLFDTEFGAGQAAILNPAGSLYTSLTTTLAKPLDRFRSTQSIKLTSGTNIVAGMSALIDRKEHITLGSGNPTFVGSIRGEQGTHPQSHGTDAPVLIAHESIEIGNLDFGTENDVRHLIKLRIKAKKDGIFYPMPEYYLLDFPEPPNYDWCCVYLVDVTPSDGNEKRPSISVKADQGVSYAQTQNVDYLSSTGALLHKEKIEYKTDADGFSYMFLPKSVAINTPSSSESIGEIKISGSDRSFKIKTVPDQPYAHVTECLP